MKNRIFRFQNIEAFKKRDNKGSTQFLEFSLSFFSVFDCLLYRPPNTQDIAEYCEVQRVLREEIVNPLRKNWFVRADRVMKLRQLLDSLTSVRGLYKKFKNDL